MIPRQNPWLRLRISSNLRLTSQTIGLPLEALREAESEVWYPILEHIRTDWMQDILDVSRDLQGMQMLLQTEMVVIKTGSALPSFEHTSSKQ